MGLNRREWLMTAAQLSLTAGAARPANFSEPHIWTLNEAALQVRKRRISSEELTRLMLTRIQQRDKQLNAFITVTADLALDQARACDRDLRAGIIRGPLHGVPIALKDNIDTAGILTTAAARFYEKRVPTEDAEVTRRLAQAGSVMLGKTNLDEFAFAGSGTTRLFRAGT
jgi:aspartyl-tRNA(Asn)/glutamyl-tRNA(Gln) amidotransferase subunit A